MPPEALRHSPFFAFVARAMRPLRDEPIPRKLRNGIPKLQAPHERDCSGSQREATNMMSVMVMWTLCLRWLLPVRADVVTRPLLPLFPGLNHWLPRAELIRLRLAPIHAPTHRRRP